MAKNRDLKVELINELAFLIGLQEKAWKYHPNNPNATSIVDEYAQLQIDIEAVEKALKDVD
ncbi:hypothetical protein OAC50_00685 [bacterium]|jgi:hypothetical protein|nr:hypothetical protein [bacterium]|tara:strand:+ start:841 stop:1023 length:183 start_codon:yes stop_codon:yes gene_type:complete